MAFFHYFGNIDNFPGVAPTHHFSKGLAGCTQSRNIYIRFKVEKVFWMFNTVMLLVLAPLY